MDLEIEYLERLRSSLTLVHLSHFVLDTGTWFISYSGLFSVKSFFLALSKLSNPSPFFLTNFVWKSEVPSKVTAFAWIVAHKKVSINDMLQLRRPYKSISPNWYILCIGNGELTNYLFLHCSTTLGLQHKSFNITKMVWVPPNSIRNILPITLRGFGSSTRGKTL